MEKLVSKLSQAEREEVELEYHQMDPEEFDAQMAQANPHIPNAVYLPPQLAATLQAMAESAGETGYQEMVRRWIEERLQQERKAAGAR